MHFINLIFILICFSFSARGQIFSAARYCAMGNTGTALQGLESLTANAAGIAELSAPTVGVYYQQHFLSTSIRTQGALLALPTKWGVVGMNLMDYGIRQTYSELQARATYARHFGHRLYAALTVAYHQLHVHQYGTSRAYTVDVGLQYRIQPDWLVGVQLSNPAQAAYDYSLYAVIPVYLRIGTSYRLHQHLLVTADLEKVLYRKKNDARAGLEFQPNDWIRIQGGIGLNELTQFCGFGASYKHTIFQLTAVVHSRLGVSPQLFLAYAF